MIPPRPVYRCDLNESAYPPLPEVAEAIASATRTANRYPEFLPHGPRAAVAAHLGLDPDCVTVGAGGTAVVASLLAEAASRPGAPTLSAPRLSTPMPTFDGFAILGRMLGYDVDPTPLHDDGAPDLAALAASVTPSTAAVIVCSPHNPTGAVLGEDRIRGLLAALPDDLPVILDEAYVEYCAAPPDSRALVADHPNLVVLRTFSKAYGLAGVRVGYAFGAPGAVAGARRREVPFGISAAAQAAVPAALAARRPLAERVAAMRRERDRLTAGLVAIGCPVLPSQANFVYLPGEVGIEVGRVLRGVGVLGREYAGHGFRLTVADEAVTDYVLGALELTAHCA
ncbi:MAG: aminotransferase class I/II-fold pyridoxal phosphate-dependent enzyme [Gordonia sp. (in: high G+C Gram-positive bacteria)]|uniref:pyridoxal phosphate-dependent aminotransferase n=1 Tax=Gordonia sp. (in: high G+C Gram-positive bacteria) TaxID=84139 RepID=UPI0039E6EF70